MGIFIKTTKPSAPEPKSEAEQAFDACRQHLHELQKQRGKLLCSLRQVGERFMSIDKYYRAAAEATELRLAFGDVWHMQANQTPRTCSELRAAADANVNANGFSHGSNRSGESNGQVPSRASVSRASIPPSRASIPLSRASVNRSPTSSKDLELRRERARTARIPYKVEVHEPSDDLDYIEERQRPIINPGLIAPLDAAIAAANADLRSDDIQAAKLAVEDVAVEVERFESDVRALEAQVRVLHMRSFPFGN